MTEPKIKPGRPQVDSVPQGAAVKKALGDDHSADIDRWNGFSKGDAAKLAKDKPTPADATIPLAGLPRDRR